MLTTPLWPSVASWGDIRLTALLTPDSPLRAPARQIVRQALRQILETHFGSPAAVLLDEPGQPLRVVDSSIAISISHDAGLSVLAVRPAGALGIDLLRLDAIPPEAEERRQLAATYFGHAASAAAPEALAFARAWTRHEASLKCLGQPLAEWRSDLAPAIAGLDIRELTLPAPYVGSIACTPGPDEPARSPL